MGISCQVGRRPFGCAGRAGRARLHSAASYPERGSPLLSTNEKGTDMSAAAWATVERPRQGPPRCGRTWAVRVDPSEVAGAVRRAAAGDKDAWDEIVDSFTGLVWSVANGHRLGPADGA